VEGHNEIRQRTLDQQEQDDFLDCVMEGGMGFSCRTMHRPMIEWRKEKSRQCILEG